MPELSLADQNARPKSNSFRLSLTAQNIHRCATAMTSTTLLRAITALAASTFGVAAYGAQNANAKLERNYEEAEARMDELEGTLRGHIGIIEESLERLEKQAGSQGLGKGMGAKAEELYAGRGRDQQEGGGGK